MSDAVGEPMDRPDGLATVTGAADYTAHIALPITLDRLL
jgi:CO/xanthine dehydrogenase Mo-binding subunit